MPIKLYHYTFDHGIFGISKGIVFADSEWDAYNKLSSYYGTTEEELRKRNNRFEELDIKYEQTYGPTDLRTYAKHDVIPFM